MHQRSGYTYKRSCFVTHRRTNNKPNTSIYTYLLEDFNLNRVEQAEQDFIIYRVEEDQP